MSEERLQKILARAGVASRRKAEELIREGRVTVNGRPAVIGDKADPARDSVKLDEQRIQPPVTHRYLLLNKPRGVMSTVADPAGRTTVIDLVPPPMRRALAPVGRLDFQTEGLLLLTDDGDLAQQVAHPSFGCWKTYEVKVRGRPAAEQIERLRAGIVLEGRRTAPCRIAALARSSKTTPAAARRARAGGGPGGPGTSGRRSQRPRRTAPESDNASWWSVELGEGRTRQIREMFQRIGHPVQKLRRVAIGPVSDPDLPVGSLRELSEREVAALRRARPPAQRPAGAARKAAPERKTAAAGPGADAAGRRPERAPRKATLPGGRTGDRAASPGPSDRERSSPGRTPSPDSRQPVGRGRAAAVREAGGGRGKSVDAGRGGRSAGPGGRDRSGNAGRGRSAGLGDRGRSGNAGRGGRTAGAGDRGKFGDAPHRGRSSGPGDHQGKSPGAGRTGRSTGPGGRAMSRDSGRSGGSTDPGDRGRSRDAGSRGKSRDAGHTGRSAGPVGHGRSRDSGRAGRPAGPGKSAPRGRDTRRGPAGRRRR